MLSESAQETIRNDGFCVVENVLDQELLARVNGALQRAVDNSRKFGIATHTETMDPNAFNVRVYNLPEHDPVFVELLAHPTALAHVAEVLGEHFIISNFSANIALPGSLPMNLHSDQALAVPPPWLAPWAINIIWCLDDVNERNGATRYLPGSHQFRTFADVPPDAYKSTVAFEAPAGSMIAMEGRLWHTSGPNLSERDRRAMMFAYYAPDFIRPQINWEASLSDRTKGQLDSRMRGLFGLGPVGNTRIGGGLVNLAKGKLGG